MRTYYYHIIAENGRHSRGMVSLGVERDFSARLWLEKQYHGIVISLWRLPRWCALVKDYRDYLFHGQINRESLSELLRDMALMSAGGLPMLDSLNVLAADSPDDDRPGVARVARLLLRAIGTGVSVNDAFERHADIFPETVRNLVRIGESSGTLDKTLMEAAEHIERITSIRNDIRTAMIYPVILFCSIFAVGIFWIYYVIPNMAVLFRQLHAKLPAITLALVACSDWLLAHLKLGISLFVIVVLGCVLAIRHVPAVRRGLYELGHRLPLSRTLLCSSGLAYFTEHLALLIRSGMDVVSSFAILERSTHDTFYRRRLREISQRLARGERIATAMQQVGGFPTLVVRMISVGEESGALDTQLRHLAIDYRKRLDRLIANIGELFKPLMILLAGGLLMFLVVSMLLPIYDLIRQSVLAPMGGG